MLELKLAKNKMENEEGMNHLLMKVTPEVSTEKVEKPVAFVLVLDVSGSMNSPMHRPSFPVHSQINGHNVLGVSIPSTETSTKLDSVKQASERLVDMMKDGDMLGVVSFSDTASLEYPLTSLNQEVRFGLKDRIRKLRTRGMTNVSDGLELAYRQIPQTLKETHHIKLILLSDGHANYGIVDPDNMGNLVQAYQKNDVSVSTVGVGNDYNSYFMEIIATVSGGMFYHLKEMNQLNAIFTSELENLTALTTKQVTLRIELPNGVQLEENVNGFTEYEKGHIFLGNVFSSQNILTEIFTEAEIAVGERSIRVTLEYTNTKDEKKIVQQSIALDIVKEEDMDDVRTNEEVVNLVKQMMEAKTKKEALRAYEDGNIDLATNAMSQSRGKLQAMAQSYSADFGEVVGELTRLEDSISMFKLDKSDAKTLYANSFNATRSKKED